MKRGVCILHNTLRLSEWDWRSSLSNVFLRITVEEFTSSILTSLSYCAVAKCEQIYYTNFRICLQVKLREKPGESNDVERPTSIADRMSLLQGAQKDWQKRISLKDVKQFTVEGKLSMAGLCMTIFCSFVFYASQDGTQSSLKWMRYWKPVITFLSKFCTIRSRGRICISDLVQKRKVRGKVKIVLKLEICWTADR